VKSSGYISAEAARGQKIEEHVITDLDQHNDENRSSLISSAVAEERQDVSSKNAITGGNNIGLWALWPLWPANIPEQIREYWLKHETGSF